MKNGVGLKILDKNGLTSLQSLPLLSNLQTLWINNNKLNNLIDVAMKLHKSTSNLTYLSMMKNPLCPDIFKDPSLEKSYRRYRSDCRFRTNLNPDSTHPNSTEKYRNQETLIPNLNPGTIPTPTAAYPNPNPISRNPAESLDT
eukprot:891561-Amorphochlora_amoeboformis.AAC.2